ncbi:MAG TPA: MarP family serine protease [Thermoleophilaceae bacterium]|nr:MarP family serine protease [Thermoleophilaceae bacterium]
MTWLDIAIVGFALVMATWGFAQGLVVGAMSLAGFVGGAVLGSRIGPLLLEEGARSPFAPLFALVGALLLGGVLATTLEVAGYHLRQRLGERLGVLDGVGGAGLIACLALGLAWIVGAVALQTAGIREVRQTVQRSHILRALNDTLPPSGPILNALARFDPVPQIRGPAPDVRPPDRAIARDSQVRAAGRSVVRILGTACGLGVQGSGWVADSDVVVTNAHVVAGQDDTRVELRDGSTHEAEAIWFDPENDLAIVRSSGVASAGTPALELDVGESAGTSAAILGFPQNGPFTVRAGRLGETRTVMSQDAYGRGPVQRRITSVRGRVRSGNSGGPMVDGEGDVVTTIFASSVSRGSTGFGIPATITRSALERADERVGTGPCPSG